jgi:phosphoenolpyruvate carboxykinase (GTP)
MTATLGSASQVPTKHKALLAWVDEMAKLTKPDKIVWCDGSDAEKDRLTREMVSSGTLIPLDAKKRPGSYLHRSNPNDVARVEHLTFICTPTKEEAGPTNNWMAPADAYQKLSALYDGSMRGRTMYVIPYVMGPLGSQFSKVGVELTDSPYVVLNMRIMTRMGKVALDMLGESGEWNKGLHSILDCNPERRFICHFPQDNTTIPAACNRGGAVRPPRCAATNASRMAVTAARGSSRARAAASSRTVITAESSTTARPCCQVLAGCALD